MWLGILVMVVSMFFLIHQYYEKKQQLTEADIYWMSSDKMSSHHWNELQTEQHMTSQLCSLGFKFIKANN